MKTLKHIVALSAAGLLAACSSLAPTVYIPKQNGSLGDASSSGDISVALHPESPSIRRGDKINFDISIRNIGAQPVVISRNPELTLTWIYPDGRHDNSIGGLAAPPPGSDLVTLDPGQQIVEHSSVLTYYFHRLGITEFRAIVSATGPANAWTGRAISNGYGVMIE